MKTVVPVEVTPSTLISTNVTNNYPDWTSGTYSLGDRVVYENEVYEVVADPDTTDRPDIGSEKEVPTWIILGWSNQYRMFREGVDSLSTETGSIEVEIQLSEVVDTVGVLGIIGNNITVELTDPIEGVVYTKTYDLVDIGASDWWEYFFLPYEQVANVIFEDIPPYANAILRITINSATGTGDVSCGRVVFGTSINIGNIQYGTNVGVIEYSIKERDGFGNLRLVPRRTIKRIDFDLVLETQRLSYIQRELKKLSSTPSLYIGNSNTEFTIIFGIYRDFDLSADSPDVSYGTLQIEEF